MARIRRLVLDVLKPHEPGIVEFTTALGDVEGVAGVTGTLVEIDENVRSLRISVEGEELDPGAIEERVAGLGGSVHSIDEVACGEYVVEDGWTAHR